MEQKHCVCLTCVESTARFVEVGGVESYVWPWLCGVVTGTMEQIGSEGRLSRKTK